MRDMISAVHYLHSKVNFYSYLRSYPTLPYPYLSNFSFCLPLHIYFLNNIIFLLCKIWNPYLQYINIIWYLCIYMNLSVERFLPYFFLTVYYFASFLIWLYESFISTFLYWQFILVSIFLFFKGILHRDLKLENFLFEERNCNSPLVLIDFGLSKHFDPEDKLTHRGQFKLEKLRKVDKIRKEKRREE